MSVSGVTLGQSIQSSSASTAASSTSIFGEIWDTINPLQHIPVVSNIYRAVSGETISGFAHVVGSTIFGGPIGGGIAAASEIGKAIFGGNDEPAINAAQPQQTLGEQAGLKNKHGAKAGIQENSTSNINIASTHKMRVTTYDWLNSSPVTAGTNLVA